MILNSGTTFTAHPSATFDSPRTVARVVQLSQAIQQRLRFLQVFGVKAFSKPSITSGEYLEGCGFLSLLLPQSGEIGGGAQFPGFSVLPARDFEGFDETRFGGLDSQGGAATVQA